LDAANFLDCGFNIYFAGQQVQLGLAPQGSPVFSVNVLCVCSKIHVTKQGFRYTDLPNVHVASRVPYWKIL
jgi:hypothetical protein